MTMTVIQQVFTVAAVVLATMLTRFLPFIFFSGRRTPKFVAYLGKVLPSAVMGLLVVYSLKDTSFSQGIPWATIAGVITVYVAHKWKKNMLLSICSGTIVYVLLINIL